MSSDGMMWAAGATAVFGGLATTAALLQRDARTVSETAREPPGWAAVAGGFVLGLGMLAMGLFSFNRSGFLVGVRGTVERVEEVSTGKEKQYVAHLRSDGGTRALEVSWAAQRGCRAGDRFVRRPLSLGVQCADRAYWHVDPALAVVALCGGAYVLRMALEDLRRRRRVT